MPDLPSKYIHADHEARIREAWDDSGATHANPSRVISGEAKPFCILIPPPNVTAALHLGHALNNTLQDVLVRAHRMKGFEALWMPGTDHAGIATQTVVEKRVLADEGRKRTDFPRDEFVAKIQAFKDEYEATITQQLKVLGSSCDWPRQRFTMDDICARAVREAFFQLFKAGLIYRGKRLVNWDPVTQTALADDEVEMEEVHGRFYYLRYPLVHPPSNHNDLHDCQEVTWSELAVRGYPGAADHAEDEEAWITVATTRPETYLGDTAVAVNPDDPRAASLRGLMVQLPIVGRVIPIVEDDYVVLPDPESSDAKAKFATGFLKVTPAHDPNDYDLYHRHKETIDNPQGADGNGLINILAPDASISDQHGWDREARGEDGHVFLGLSREDARELVAKEFRDRNLLENVKPYSHSVGHSYRSHVPIEPYLSDQWYVKVTDDALVGEAQRALAKSQRTPESITEWPKSNPGSEAGDDAITFFPSRYAKTYEFWHDNLRDWCISRQLWWGHRIAVWRPSIKLIDTLDLDQLAAVFEKFSIKSLEGRIALQYRGEFVALDSIELDDKDLAAFYVCVRDPEGQDQDIVRELEAIGLQQDPDVLDTWFSSALWPISTMGWPDPAAAARDTGIDDFPDLLQAFNPSTVLSTGRDIITLWVSRMAMFNRFLRKDEDGSGVIPFHHVYIHPIVQDGHGQRMSKSLGNGVDPRDIIDTHGADALRFILCQVATATQDVRMPVDLACPHCAHAFEPKFIKSPGGNLVAEPRQTCPKCSKQMITPFGVTSGQVAPSKEAPVARNTSTKFDAGRNFANKLWNASRLAISKLETKADSEGDLTLADTWIISRIAHTIEQIDDSIASYQFSSYAQHTYDLLWRDFCDWYLEAVKPTAAKNSRQQDVLSAALETILRILHPLIPFVTEAIYEHVRGLPARAQDSPAGLDLGTARPELLISAPWPRASSSLRNADAEIQFDRVRALVRQIREVRAQHQVHRARRITLHIPTEFATIANKDNLVAELAVLETITTDAPEGAAVSFMFESSEFQVSNLADQIDQGAELERLEKRIEDLQKSIKTLQGRLSNESYVSKAPPALVDQTRAQLAEAEAELESTTQALAQVQS